MNSPTAPPKVDEGQKQLIDAADLSDRLGLTKTKIYELVRTRAIPHIRIGNRVFFRPAAIDEWLDQLEGETQ